MAYLFFQTWIWLLLAAIFGIFLGWLVWGRRDPDADTNQADALAQYRARVAELEKLLSAKSPDTDPDAESSRAPILGKPQSRAADDQATNSDESDSPDQNDSDKPGMLDGPHGNPDDLKIISGVGPVLEKTLNELGIFHYRQIADFSPENVAWVNEYLRFSGRIEREKWIEQASKLARGEGTAYSRRYDKK